VASVRVHLITVTLHLSPVGTLLGRRALLSSLFGLQLVLPSAGSGALNAGLADAVF
jgi:hypothetical protein